jgi:hypothetical protein
VWEGEWRCGMVIGQEIQGAGLKMWKVGEDLDMERVRIKKLEVSEGCLCQKTN